MALRLLLGGSPCTFWSIAQKANRETEAEGMGWELFKNYLIAREKYRPRYFLYENNKSMAAAIKAQITHELGVEPILINSSLVSAQNRERYYWTNIPCVQQPVDRGILLRDVLETGESWLPKAYTLDANYYKTLGNRGFETQSGRRKMVAEPVFGRIVGRRIGENGHRDDYNTDLEHVQRFEVNADPGKSNTITTVQKDNMVVEPIGTTRDGKAYALKANYTNSSPTNYVDPQHFPQSGAALPVQIGEIADHGGQYRNGKQASKQYRVYSCDAKAGALCGSDGGAGAATGLYAAPLPAGAARRGRGETSPIEIRGDEKANAVIVGHQHRLVVEWWDGKTYPVYMVKDGKITINEKTYPIKLADGFYIIRKLTVTECKRLQTVPDDYIFPVSNTQAYKMLGNGWTVDVITHILSFIPGITTVPLEVLSMYDGMSCGRIALNKLRAAVAQYYATEIDKYAVQTTQHNFPDTMQLGDAFQVRADWWTLEGVADIW